MQITSLVFLVLFLGISIVHLYFCFKENDQRRFQTKPFCLLLLSISFIFMLPSQPIIYIGALCALAGDIFLIWKKNKVMFFFGMLVFLASHLLYMVAITQLFAYQFAYWGYLIWFGSLIFASLITYFILKKHLPGIVGIIGLFYLGLLLSLMVFGIVFAINSPKPIVGIIFAIGYLFAFISDVILAYAKFIKDIKRRDFFIMLFYLLAELLILLSFVLFFY